MGNGLEFPLSGGRVTKGVVRIGDTVRRPPTANSAFVRRLLSHLASKGFNAAPVPLGADERGREVFSFIGGDVPAELGLHGDETLRQAARLIRRLHDLCSELVAMPGVPAPAGRETICHNDLSPCNFVFRDGVPVAIIDFDAAAPGSRADDLGYAAWLWLDLGNPEIGAREQGRRLSLFRAAYGFGDVRTILTAIFRRQELLAARGLSGGDRPMAGWAADCLEWTRQNQAALLAP